MITAVNHMPLIDRITTTLLKPHTQKLREARLIVADCNLPADTLFWLASLGVPIAVDAVSSAKADRLAPLIGRIDILKCTYPEATRITGRTDSPAELASALCIENTRIVLMSMGAEPLILATPSEVMSFTPPPARIISVTGAGDALFASFIHQYISGSQITICAEAGLRAAAITMGCRQAVHPEIASLC
jgi:pseudouridine kinase